jgi:hypothetical protein
MGVAAAAPICQWLYLAFMPSINAFSIQAKPVRRVNVEPVGQAGSALIGRQHAADRMRGHQCRYVY